MSNLSLINSFSKLNVLVIGEAILDCYLNGSSDRLCPEAPVPVVNITERLNVPGGAANTALNVSSLGGQVKFLSVIGEDPEAALLKQSLESQGVSTAYLLQERSRQTLSKQRIIASSHLLVRFDQGSTHPISSELETRLIDRLVELFPTCDALIVSDYGYGILTPSVIRTLEELQRRSPCTLVVDSKQLTEYQSINVTAVKPNYSQATHLLGLKKLETNADRIDQILLHGEKLLDLTRANIAAVTLDRGGALIFERDRPPHRTYVKPAPQSQTSGAGDTFTSTLALAIAAGADTSTAADLAAAATAIVVAQPGTTACSVAALRQSVDEVDSNLPHPNLKLNQQKVGDEREFSKLLITKNQLERQLNRYRDSGQRIVFTNGCFDILHRGHVTYLNQAKALGDVLIVGVNSDESVRQLKGNTRPVNALADRMAVLAALNCVDAIAPFDEINPCNLIQLIRPQVFVKGGDYTRETLPEASLVEDLGGVVKILPFVSDRSTTQLIQQIQNLKTYDTSSLG
ncbi:D-glycero-beta-D-manno-heptose 1-phosphate adenylyltransferase [Leptolyngbya sp. FACHB-671]|uniref:D-glycero-beta-D-manno-heptose 1-phosphate adenylyltransferase n=1 Tax=Leptolyngbya sp. FACHB-671 TaxID=2692812 RepID=UPI00168A0E6B|nr:D-glycero-beta-D-manno-heptose 1-phosphate adenylyltransferase [Leptolyngbya sp. FACHB-671]MBD2072014.1 D-glycero-beta-D-manno-heptose 1-phosphate adenylyltransferase [Leptolyngbya sp. FACHB-671]